MGNCCSNQENLLDYFGEGKIVTEFSTNLQEYNLGTYEFTIDFENEYQVFECLIIYILGWYEEDIRTNNLIKKNIGTLVFICDQ